MQEPTGKMSEAVVGAPQTLSPDSPINTPTDGPAEGWHESTSDAPGSTGLAPTGEWQDTPATPAQSTPEQPTPEQLTPEQHKAQLFAEAVETGLIAPGQTVTMADGNIITEQNKWMASHITPDELQTHLDTLNQSLDPEVIGKNRQTNFFTEVDSVLAALHPDKTDAERQQLLTDFKKTEPENPEDLAEFLTKLLTSGADQQSSEFQEQVEKTKRSFLETLKVDAIDWTIGTAKYNSMEDFIDALFASDGYRTRAGGSGFKSKSESEHDGQPFDVKDFQEVAKYFDGAESLRAGYQKIFIKLYQELKVQGVDILNADDLLNGATDDESFSKKATAVFKTLTDASQKGNGANIQLAFQKTLPEKFTKEHYVTSELVAHFGHLGGRSGEVTRLLGKE